MSLSEQTVKCPLCSNPYKTYAFYAGDQSACSKCVKKAENAAVSINDHPLRDEIVNAIKSGKLVAS